MAIRLTDVAVMLSLVLGGQALAQSTTSLKKLSLDELMQVEVTSVSKRTEKLADAPASIFVISSEDIRRSGASTLPEALRLAPNLEVARMDAVQYAISARGFNNAIGNKLLVLIDGRTVYTPLFSGVFWDQQEVMLEDIERIEVISGPGATLWGANAVNGVINVITRNASETSGALFVGDVGDNERGGSLRYGGGFASGAFRVYGKFFNWDHTSRADGGAVPDAWRRGQAGFRADWKAADDAFTLQGDAYDGHSQERGSFGTLLIPAVTVSGMNLLGRWQRQLNGGAEFQLQTYFDHSKRDEAVLFRPDSDIFDIEIQHAIPRGRQQLLWGAGYRHGRDSVAPGIFTAFIPASRTLAWSDVFLQDEISLRERLRATLGVKLERNDYTGVEYLPSARLAWKFPAGGLLWSSLSRSVRAPARLDRDIVFPATPPYLVVGGPDFQSEVADVFELGYRAQAASTLSYSVTAFVHLWDRLRSGTAVPVVLENKIEGTTQGIEAWGSYQPLSFWVLHAGVTYLDENLRLKAGSTDPVGARNPNLRNDPHCQWTVRSSFDLPRNVQLDLDLRGVGSLPQPPVPAYTDLDVRLAWLALSNMELSLTGRNLLHAEHPEFGSLPGRSAIQRNLYGQLLWRF